jgi:hypothetical protein
VPFGKPRVYPIFKKITSVGSAGGNDVCIDGHGLADYHAQVIFDGRDFNLSEVDTRGEILINGKKKRRGKLIHNDRLTLGAVELSFSLYDEPAADSDGDGATELTGLRKLYEFSQRLMEVRSVSALIEQLMDAVIDVTAADKGFLVLIEDGIPRVAVARNLQQQALPDGVRHLSDSIIQRVMQTRKPLIVSDALHDEHFKSSVSVMNL